MTFGRSALLLAAMIIPAAARADVVPVQNGSFESPTVPPEDIAHPGADGWVTTGGINAGIFPNLAQDVDFGGVIARRITNADGNQLAYIGAQNLPATGPNSFSQQLSSSFTPGQAYALSVGVAISSVQPPDSGAMLRLEFYYLNNGVVQPVASQIVVNDSATGLSNSALSYFHVDTPVVATDAPYANHPIGILLTTADNGPGTGGTFDMDNVTVTSVPEPSCLALVGAGALVLLRRRR